MNLCRKKNLLQVLVRKWAKVIILVLLLVEASLFVFPVKSTVKNVALYMESSFESKKKLGRRSALTVALKVFCKLKSTKASLPLMITEVVLFDCEEK